MHSMQMEQSYLVELILQKGEGTGYLQSIFDVFHDSISTIRQGGWSDAIALLGFGRRKRRYDLELSAHLRVRRRT